MEAGLHNLRLVLITNFFLKILSLKSVCCVFRDKSAVNQGFWSKTAVFSPQSSGEMQQNELLIKLSHEDQR